MDKEKSPTLADDASLRLLVNLDDAMHSAASLHDFIAIAHQQLQGVFDAPNMAVILYSGQSSAVFCKYHKDTQQAAWPKEQPLTPSTLEHSALSYVLHNQHKLLLASTRESTEWKGGMLGKSWMGFPLTSLNQACLGAVCVYSYNNALGYTAKETQLMQMVTRQVSAAVERFNQYIPNIPTKADRTALLERELREKEKAEKLHRVLYEIATLITQELELSQLYQNLHTIIAELLYANNFFIAMLDEEQKHLTFSYFVDEKDGFETEFKTVEVGRGLTSYVVKTRSAQLLTPKIVKELIEQGHVDEVLGSSEFSCWMGVPLFSDNKVHGIIVLQSYDNSIVYNDADLQILNYVATHVANAIELSVAAQIKRDNQRQLELHHQQISETLVQLKTTQKELIQKEKMASLGSLVAGVAHEINTPLGICVTGVSHLAEEYRVVKQAFDAQALTKSQVVDFFTAVEKSTAILTTNTNRAAELVQSFKQVAVDQSADNIRRFCLASYINEIVLSMSPTLNQNKHNVIVNCDENITVNVNAGALSQILGNLIVNSVTHGFENSVNGEIIINAKQSNDEIHLTYKDSGKGVSKENMNKLFEPFFTTKRGRGGSGLGTHLIYNLVTSALYGSVKASSKLGQGLGYTIKFPIDGELANR